MRDNAELPGDRLCGLTMRRGANHTALPVPPLPRPNAATHLPL
jgi:hypothetical protein